MWLSDQIGGKPESDLEKAIDRFFLNRTISNMASSFFDPDRRKRELEEKLLEQSLTSDDFGSKIKNGISIASYLSNPSKKVLAKILAP